MLFCTKWFYCFVYSEKEKQMQKIREKLEAKQLKKARLVSFVNNRCFFSPSLNLVPRVLSYAGGREPWERGWPSLGSIF